MQDKITSVLKDYDLVGKSLDGNGVEFLKEFLTTGEARVQVASIIGSNAFEIVKAAVSQLFQEQPELLLPGGNAYTTRRYSMYLRDMDYSLRYCSYALVGGDTSVLDERLLAGLREVFISLGIPLGPTARSIQIMKDLVKEKAVAAGIANTTFIDEPFDYLAREIIETDL